MLKLDSVVKFNGTKPCRTHISSSAICKLISKFRCSHIASRQDHYECVVLFLARGAQCDARNNENQTPISVSED